MTSRCGTTVAKSSSLLQKHQNPCGLSTCVGWRASSLQHARTLVASFSTSQVLALRLRYVNKGQRWKREYPGQKYPGFRNETPDHRLVRENQLFNPFEYKRGDEDRTRALQESTHSGTLPLKLASDSELEREMIFWSTQTQTQRGRGRASKILSILVRDRGQDVKSLHYETLIALNSSSSQGSVASIKSLLQEMDQQNIACDVNTYTTILRSLVVHPDPDLLDRVLEGCTEMWIDLDAEMLHYITAIYVRLEMPELALEYLDRIEGLSSSSPSTANVGSTSNQPGQAELWLYVLLINQLAEKNDWEGVLRICYRLNDDTSIGPFAMRQLDIPYAFWHKLLQQSATSGDLWVTLWIWNTWVIRRWFRPSPAVCVKALQIFVRQGLKDQAYGAIQILKTFRILSDDQNKSTYMQRKVSSASNPQRSSAHTRQALIKMINEEIMTAEEKLGITTPTKEQARIAAHWTVFEHDSYSKVFAPAGLRINPWSVLSKEGADPGYLWARLANERSEKDDYAEHMKSLSATTVENGDRRTATPEPQSGLPDQLQADTDKLADLDFEARYNKLERGRLRAREPLHSTADKKESFIMDREDKDDYLNHDRGPFAILQDQIEHDIDKSSTSAVFRKIPTNRRVKSK